MNNPYAKFAIEKAAELGVPPELIPLIPRIMQQESGGKADAISPKGAIGLFQLMPATAKEMGVEDLNDPYQNIEGGIKYFKQQLDTFKDPRLALAAYNAGPEAVKEYGGIPPFKETQNYVRKIYDEWDKNPKVEIPIQPPTQPVPANITTPLSYEDGLAAGLARYGQDVKNLKQTLASQYEDYADKVADLREKYETATLPEFNIQTPDLLEGLASASTFNLYKPQTKHASKLKFG